ncbi:trypsin-like peptidase domain-containing protein [Planococcus salinus]|uniref:DUF2116 family Zn-ribbon domain-containing protein n=1 Tax=Planococcus salinus TaxID=1848460 RepID=A0A3M8P8E3_9BACL|nr:DUF2116 family Zn-ribbon domain-containing protein [Planococcus salinus]RNF39530.1 DUF2116 family Zn-ribbon domain-containing protein [Planococcus salinus]
MVCSNCGQKNKEEASFCMNCGQPLEKKRSKKPKKSKIFTAVLLLFIAIGAVFGVTQMMDEEPEPATALPEETAEVEEQEEAVEEEIEPEPEVVQEESELPPVVEGTVTNETDVMEQPIQTEPKKKDVTTIIKETQQKVYTILTEEKQGSGFLFTNDGMVVTNAHVVAGQTEVMVRNINGIDEPGRVVGISDVYDIALIQVDAFKGSEPLPISMSNTDVGTEVIALGSPSGFENTASIGYLTGIDRDFTQEFLYENIYQIDALIAPGSSGGPLVDAQTGSVIGINSLLYNDGSSIGFSIPMYSVNDQLTEWAANPMTQEEVAALFNNTDVYDGFGSENPGYEYNPDDGFDEFLLSEFVGNFRYYYELALQNEDFYYIEDMLVRDSNIYTGIAEYIDDITGKGMEYDFTALEITGTEIFDDYALVHTYEAFNFKNAAGEQSVEERNKTYTIVMDEFGFYTIADIVNN